VRDFAKPGIGAPLNRGRDPRGSWSRRLSEHALKPPGEAGKRGAEGPAHLTEFKDVQASFSALVLADEGLGAVEGPRYVLLAEPLLNAEHP